jgi:mono/diheme cytochrome c family protein
VRPLFALVLLLLAACSQKMEVQPKQLPLATARTPPAGTVRTDADLADIPAENPFPIDMALLQRGQQRFDIFCAPCHGRSGDGQGMIPQHGFPQPPDYAEPRLLAASERHFYDVIGNGYGAMFPYGARVPPADRWAIAAYIRVLQFARHASIAELTPELEARLEQVPP